MAAGNGETERGQRGSERAQSGLLRVPRGSTTGIREGIERGKGSRKHLAVFAAAILRQREESSKVRENCVSSDCGAGLE